VTPFTNGEIVAAKRSLAVMTGHAALRAAGGVMIEWFRRRHLSALWHAGPYLVAFAAGDLLMFRVIETDAKSRRRFRSARVSTQLMTSATRRDVAAAGLRRRCVTAITTRMRVKPGGDRKSHSVTRRAMTRGTTGASHPDVQRMIELHAETLQAGKRLQGAGLNIGMTDRTDGTAGI